MPGYQNLGPIAAVTVSQRIAATEAADAPPEQRAWRLWLEAQQAKNAGAFALAHEALDAADRVAGQVAPQRQPVLLLEIEGLRGKLFQDDGEPGRAYPPLNWAAQRWLTVGAAIAAPTSSAATLIASACRGASDMVFAAVGTDYVTGLAAQAGASAEMGAVTLWLDRLVTEADEIINRADQQRRRRRGLHGRARPGQRRAGQGPVLVNPRLGSAPLRGRHTPHPLLGGR